MVVGFRSNFASWPLLLTIIMVFLVLISSSMCFVFTIHPSKNPPPQNGCRRFKSVFCFLKVPVSHPPLSQSNRTFTKPTARHYTEYRFSPNIEMKEIREIEEL